MKTNQKSESDRVNHPSHYNTENPIIQIECGEGWFDLPIECIDVIRNMPTWKGNAIKYLWRAGFKQEEGISDIEKTIEDLKKAIWYIQDKIDTLERKVK